MGTGIHPAVEVRRNGIWRYHRPKEPCRWYAEVWSDQKAVDDYNARIAAYGSRSKYTPVKLGDRQNKWDTCKTRLPEFFEGRNYRVFAVVGDVRNGSGFAGVYTHDPVEPIQSNRGFPDDISIEARRKMSMEHSEGWVTLAELKAYPYHQMMTEGGVIDEDAFQRYLMTGVPPESWSGGISGQDIVTLNPDQYAALFESPIELLQGKIKGNQVRRTKDYNPKLRYYIRATWQRDLYDEVKTLPEEWVPYLERLVPRCGTDDDVRVVFDFDS